MLRIRTEDKEDSVLKRCGTLFCASAFAVACSQTDAGMIAGRDLADDAREGANRAGDAARRGMERAGEAADRAGASVADAAITSAVKTKLLADDMVRGLNIDVDTNHGLVTLNGNVSSRAEANQAVRLAQGTHGVTKVVDNLKVANR